MHLIQRRNVRPTALPKYIASIVAGLTLTAGSLCCTAASLGSEREGVSDHSFSADAQGVVPALDARVVVVADAALAPDIVRESVKPLYPEQARRDGIEGYVVVQFDIARNGTVSGVRVIEAKPANYFETAAIDAVQRFQFTPNDNTTEAVAIRGAINKFVFSLNAPNSQAKPGFIFYRGRTYYASAQ